MQIPKKQSKFILPPAKVGFYRLVCISCSAYNSAFFKDMMLKFSWYVYFSTLIMNLCVSVIFVHPTAQPTQAAKLGGKNLTLVVLGLGCWNFHKLAILGSRSKNQLQNHFFPLPSTHPTQAAMLGGKNLTLLFLGLGSWNLHQMAAFAVTQFMSAHVSLCQLRSAYVSSCQLMSAHVNKESHNSKKF